eukprot:1738849-Alexandrium_andersonii.AAC.1
MVFVDQVEKGLACIGSHRSQGRVIMQQGNTDMHQALVLLGRQEDATTSDDGLQFQKAFSASQPGSIPRGPSVPVLAQLHYNGKQARSLSCMRMQ